MSLKDHLPAIDDRRFPDIMDEIKARIARYTPEWQPVWNDFNHSDPGMILTETVAWLSEMMIYRMNQVPELNYIRFLEMLGIELRAAQPATVDVAFPVAEDCPTAFVDVPPRTQVSAMADDDGPPIVFETNRSLRALTAQLLSIQSFDGAAHGDHTADSDALIGFAPFGPLAGVGSALVLGFGFPSAYPGPADIFPAIVFEVMAYATPPSGAGSFVSCGLPASAVYSSARIVWEGWNGTGWTPIDALKDDTAAFTRTGAITLRTPAAGTLKRDYMGAYVATGAGTPPPLFWLRARLTKAQYETPPMLVTVRSNVVPALQAQTVQGEVLGGSDGTRNQTWTFASTPVIAGSAQVRIDQGLGDATWTVAVDLLDAGAQDTVLSLDPGSGTLRCGDGIHGAVPVANPNNPDANVVAIEYRYGGGARGNVPAGAVNALLSSIDHIDAGKVANPFPAVGGRDEELLAAAKERARRMVRAQCRAVTVADFEALAQQAGNVARTKALPLYHPQFPGIRFPGAVSVIIVPNAKRQDGVPFAPVPSDGLMRTVCAYLDERRLLTTELFVLAPSYHAISATVDVIADPEADSAAIRQGVENALTIYFDPLIGGDAGTGWPFGGTIHYSKVYQRIFQVSGVDTVASLVLTLDGVEQPECRDVPIPANALLMALEQDVTVLFPDEVAA